ncbi:HD-domain/PDEase-like protein [Glarea lozoyensis ATCC 20868]|uniref:Phosphodiesterase n=1 Tax=Glarea lozoyensis (strain ATCC 20868 / MF5171) TaxID=1116229 RepID=S3DDH0_GLAL2|nr:HD-domain/PDEase-like protein [Glarea lozoyensis ATCC 20868]EPE30036.1 HD-domain/PDEase-like protein [Glarea lozoyensis ATCC 20868]
MEYAACNVVYVDRTAVEGRLVKRDEIISSHPAINIQDSDVVESSNQGSTSPVDGNVKTLLGMFSEVHVCTTGSSCVAKLSELNHSSMVDLIPTLVLIDIPYEDQLATKRPSREVRTPSPSSKQPTDGILEDAVETDDESYGLGLLQWIVSEIQYQSLSKLIVPVALVTIPETTSSPGRGRTDSRTGGYLDFDPFATPKKQATLVTPLDQVRTMKYLDLGAVDVLTSPLLQDRLPSLAVHAYRAHKDASKDQRALLELKRGRKRSWVGVDDQKPYAYLREAMVSGLMDGICKLGGDDEPFSYNRIAVALDRREKIASAIGSWSFSAHDFTDDELLHAALLMLQHALEMPELERWRISTESLTGFLVASRSAYNAFVPYHNFRHVIDVLQACFHFLVQLGRLPSYPPTANETRKEPSPIAALIRPFDALTLLITAIGHDVGHPGVNNAFLVTLNAPLAQLYNDRSVLESFHCAAYSQILRRHWPVVFQSVEMRQLMISSILATDMGLHFDYMKKMGWMQEKLHENGGTDGWNARLLDEQRTLACSLLIKCADISNVARKYDVAAQWTMILTDEFSRQATMEKDLGIPSALFAAPVRETIELGKSQIGFMNMFAIPLFQGVTDVMPGMAFCVEELHCNQEVWSKKIADEQARLRADSGDAPMNDGMFSPRHLSMAAPSDTHRQRQSSATLLPSDADFTRGLSRNFTPRHGALSESPESEIPHHQSDPDITRSDSLGVDTGIQDSTSQPSQLQLSFATASAPGLLDHPSLDANALPNGHHVNGLSVMPSLVTDAVVVDPPLPCPERRQVSEKPRSPEKQESSEKQRSSDGTEAGSSAAGDWASQATSATTSKMPLSPSTQGTSITSQESAEKNTLSQTPTQSPSGFRAGGSSSVSNETQTTATEESKGGAMMEKVKSLRKKPSRFRMDKLMIWRRSKSASPPVPDISRTHRRTGSNEESVPRTAPPEI